MSIWESLFGNDVSPSQVTTNDIENKARELSQQNPGSQVSVYDTVGLNWDQQCSLYKGWNDGQGNT